MVLTTIGEQRCKRSRSVAADLLRLSPQKAEYFLWFMRDRTRNVANVAALPRLLVFQAIRSALVSK
jgi:hypothetical protein